MSTTAKRMKYAMDLIGMKQIELAERTGIGKSSISTYLSGQYLPKQKNIYKIAQVLRVSEAWLMGLDVPMRSDVAKEPSNALPPDAVPFSPTHRIPILGQISAGLPLYADEHVEGYTFTDLNGGAEYFALRVKGDSMTAARIYEGDLLIVRCQDHVEENEIAVVIVGDDEATVKRWHQKGHFVTLYPQSLNPSHFPQEYDLRKTSVRVIGKVVKVEFSV